MSSLAVNEITVVIPTYKYTKYLDKAIASALDLEFVSATVFVNINSLSDDYRQSLYWDSEVVNWRYIESPTDLPWESWNDAVNHSVGNWVIVVADDDLLCPNFLEGFDVARFSSETIFLSRLNKIDEHDNILGYGPKYENGQYNGDKSNDLFFLNKVHHHLSLILFSREMYEKVGGFVSGGYPNGYYSDTIFNGKMIVSSSQVVTSNDVMFSRRESSFQDSAKFYFNAEVNNYFTVIVDALFENQGFRNEALDRYIKREVFYKKMLQDRFRTEWFKLNMPMYNKSFSRKVEFFYKHLLYWNTGFKFKILSFLYVIQAEFVNLVPAFVKNWVTITRRVLTR